MRRCSEPQPERFVFCSERIMLECRCGEMIILLGREDDWYSEGRTVFECECGAKLTLDEEALGVKKLLRDLGATNDR